MVRELVDLYVAALWAEGKTRNTIEYHRYALGQLERWLGESGAPVDPGEWSAQSIRGFLTWLRERPARNEGTLSATSVTTIARSVHSFCVWLHEEDLIERDPFARVAIPKAPVVRKDVLSEGEIQRVLDYVRHRSRDRFRDEALVLFLLDTACRVSEVSGLREADIDWGQRLARVDGKGNKQRFAPFSHATAKAMLRYKTKARPPHEVFFLSKEGRPLTAAGVYQVLRRVGDATGIVCNPHKFRHTAATAYAASGASALQLQQLLGHTDVKMSMRYSHMTAENLIEAHERHSPVVKLHQLGRRGHTQ